VSEAGSIAEGSTGTASQAADSEGPEALLDLLLVDGRAQFETLLLRTAGRNARWPGSGSACAFMVVPMGRKEVISIARTARDLPPQRPVYPELSGHHAFQVLTQFLSRWLSGHLGPTNDGSAVAPDPRPRSREVKSGEARQGLARPEGFEPPQTQIRSLVLYPG
jgi:hypothetical protein